ncbi:MAG: hypothetical protein R2797_12355 [Gelidibacter sp.]
MKTLPLLICIVVCTILCNSCVQKTHLKTITFSVDMNQVDAVSKVGIRGDLKPLSWDETIFMTDDDQNGIYELTLDFHSAGPGLEFKFVNGNHQFELQDKDNRAIPFTYQPETINYTATFNNLDDAETVLQRKAN